MSSSIKSPVRSKAGTSGSAEDTELQTLTTFSAALSDFLWSLCIRSLVSTTVQIPEMRLDIQNHIIVSQHATLRERGRKELVFLRMFDLSPVSGFVSSRKKSKYNFGTFSILPILIYKYCRCLLVHTLLHVCVCVPLCVWGVNPGVPCDLLKGLAVIPEFLCVKCLLWVPFTACVLYGPWSHPICLSLLHFWGLFFMASQSLLEWRVSGEKRQEGRGGEWQAIQVEMFY